MFPLNSQLKKLQSSTEQTTASNCSEKLFLEYSFKNTESQI